jgi:hypothetical protein
MSNTDIAKTLELPHGLEIDLDQAWRKLISRQFGGSAGRGFAELIQNFIDAYPSGTDWADRRAEIVTGPDSIAITDWGEGMNRNRLRLLVTLGGTDKDQDASKIGKFGIGFFSIFNPALGTRRVTVHTRCEGHGVELAFEVSQPEQRPRLVARTTEKQPEFGTRVAVEFADGHSPQLCVSTARDFLRHFPCPVTIDGKLVPSVWSDARQAKRPIFEHNGCRGFLIPDRWGESLTILCRYERLMELSVGQFATGGHDMKWDLRDLAGRAVPWLPGTHAVLNSNDLNVTISRDGFYLDGAYARMVGALATALEQALGKKLPSLPPDADSTLRLVVGNQLTLRERLGRHVRERVAGGKVPEGQEVLALLAEAPAYQLCGEPGWVSLLDIARRRTADLPVFHLPSAEHETWLGGSFKHDFIVAPRLDGGRVDAPEPYQAIFAAVFGADVVDLSRIRGETDTIARLVERGIVDPALLSPQTARVETSELEPDELALVNEINDLFQMPEISRTLRLDLGRGYLGIEAAYFESTCSGLAAATGLLDDEGRPFGSQTDMARRLGRIFIGLRRSHPVVQAFARSRDPMRAYFAVSFLTQHLAQSQKALVPHDRLAHAVPDHLGVELRHAMLATLVAEQSSDNQAAAS